MGHITSKDAYKNLEDRINWFTQGAPPSDTFYKILQVLYTEKEAKWVALLPVRPFTLKKAARIWGTTEAKAEKVLDHLCEKALLVDSTYRGVRRFVMPPPMAGFIEFALMRTRGDIDQKYLSELYYQYMNVEEDFVKDLFFATETKLGRVYVQEPVLTTENTLHILDHERASHIVEEAAYIGLGTCYCRHKAFHAGHPCEIDAPWDVCLTFGNVARSLAEHGGHARLISKEEAIWSVLMTRDLCRSGRMSGRTRHLSATAAGAAVRLSRLPENFPPCSLLQRPIISRRWKIRPVSDAENAKNHVLFLPFPWRKSGRAGKRKNTLWWIRISALAAGCARPDVPTVP